MDTNRNDGQNYQINTFNKGMNTDTALDAVGEGQYIFGQNIRIANNTLLLGDMDPNSKEGLVTPIEEGKTISDIDFGEITSILATASIGDVGVVIVKYPHAVENSDPEQRWKVYRVDKIGDTLSANLLYNSKSATGKDKFSVVINKEQEDIIKLYIADGEHGIMQLFVKNGENDPDPLASLNKANSEDDLVSGKYFPSDKATIIGTTSGRLKTSQVQYTYRFYKRYGIFSKTAPLTNKIQIINSNRSVEEGNAENTRTNLGMKLQITIPKAVNDIFDHLQLIRIAYVVAGQVPEIDIVKDVQFTPESWPQTQVEGQYQDDEQIQFNITDAGDDSLQELSLDEFASLNTQSIIPQVIEQNQGFMFAANITDETVISLDQQTIDDYQLYRGQPEYKRISWRFVYPEIEVCGQDMEPCNLSTQTYFNQLLQGQTQSEQTELSISNFLSSHKIEEPDQGIFNSGYNNNMVSSLFRSLARGETYTYGIVFYTIFGQKTDVIAIADITIPEESELPSWKYHNDKLYTYPIGIEFLVDKPDWAVGYEIVQKQKTLSEFKYLLQCALSRPVQQTYGGEKLERDKHLSPYYPLPFITSNFCSITHQEHSNDGNNQNMLGYFCRNTRNRNLFQAFSPEILYRRSDILTLLSTANVELLCNYYTYDEFGDLCNIRKSSAYNSDNDETKWHQGAFDGDIDFTNATMIRYNSTDSNADSSEFESGVFVIRPHLSGFKKDAKASDANEIKLFGRSAFKETNNSLQLQYLPNAASENTTWFQTVNSYANSTTQNNTFYHTKKDAFDTSNPINSDNVLLSAQVIKNVKDVKNPIWNSGFADIQTTGDNSQMSSGIKAYKGYTTAISAEYLNWICSGMYDLPITKNEADNYFLHTPDNNRTKQQYRALSDTVLDYYAWRSGSSTPEEKTDISRGWIGPGPICFLFDIETPNDDNHVLNLQILPPTTEKTPGTIIANVQNKQQHFDDRKEYYTYFGQGNYYKEQTAIVFDGDRYILPCEFVSLFKTYDFKSIDDTLDSSQVVYYIPLESKVNPFFDYGMNYRNTQSKNLLLEPGSITGITTQDRPLHQYNQIYSDNTTSVSIYTAQPLETSINKFPQRICYSQHKDNGEQIESWNIFKPVDYIDADTRYGEVTNLLSANDTIFFWQDRAFGKLSVNERSLITDNNSNTIQLGQGGVLQRTDYLSTRYGMRLEDYSAINTENGLFWIDILNKAIVANTQNGVVNYGEMLNVQNLINKNITTDKPEIDYDLQNSELLCKCFGANQLVFNIKYNIATAIYTRVYDKILYFNNIMYALNGYNEISQLNYLSTSDETLLLSPTIIQFAVNNSPSQTKVFDNQKIVVANKQWNNNIDNMYSQQLTFNTELNQNRLNVQLSEIATNREGNICYAVPRDNDGISRMRGKWMTVKITDNTPEQDFAISHIITKFRQSYS